jgi:periplasmic divalent cation tolerance protein
MSQAIVVFMTAANPGEAQRIAEHLVNAQLAACVQVLPGMESVYRWKNEVQREKEVLMMAKTTAAKFAELEQRVRAMHSYETPEIVAVPITAVSEPYRVWLFDSIA